MLTLLIRQLAERVQGCKAFAEVDLLDRQQDQCGIVGAHPN